VATAAPAIFTADSTGAGQSAALNQNYSYNNSTNPAAPGSVLILYVTGAGQTSPAGIDGFVSAGANTLASPVQTVTAQIGGLPAMVLYAGTSVGIISGALQVNVLVPSGLSRGPQSVVLRVGSAATQPAVSVAIQ
jgi:trimeric autotransporter adhesin